MRSKKKKKIDSQFFTIALISIIIVVGFFAAANANRNFSGYATSSKKVSIWHCGFYSTNYDPKGSWRWVSWPDEEIRLERKIGQKDANCVKGEWVCSYPTCGSNSKVEDCYCYE